MLNFYRVMHYSAKHGLVIACCLYIFVVNFCTHFHHAKPRPGRGQSLEAEAEAKILASRPAWPRGLNITAYQARCRVSHGAVRHQSACSTYGIVSDVKERLVN